MPRDALSLEIYEMFQELQGQTSDFYEAVRVVHRKKYPNSDLVIETTIETLRTDGGKVKRHKGAP